MGVRLRSIIFTLVLLQIEAFLPLHIPASLIETQHFAKSPVQEKEEKALTTEATGIYGYRLEVIEKEKEEAPFRGLRNGAILCTGSIAIICAGISLAGLLGIDQAKEVAEKFNLPNPLLDIGVLATGWYLYVEDIKVKRSRLKLIDDERKGKGTAATIKPNRGERRRAQKAEKGPGAAKKGFKRDDGAVTPDIKVEAEPPTSAKQTAPDESTDSGMFSNFRKTLRDVNQQSYAQALALNSQLEEKGILPPIRRTDTAASEETKSDEDKATESE